MFLKSINKIIPSIIIVIAFFLRSEFTALILIPTLAYYIKTTKTQIKSIDIILYIYIFLCVVTNIGNNNPILFNLQSTFLYSVLPILFYYFGKHYFSFKTNVKFIPFFLQALLIIFIILVLSIFFRDQNNKISFNLSNNIYYLFRIKQINKDDLDYFISATNLSLLIATIPIISMILYNIKKIKIYVYITLLILSIILLSVVASRAAIIATLIILILNLSLILKSKNVIKYFFGILAIASILVFIIPEFEYTRTAMDRFNNLNLQSETNELYDLNGRQYYWSLALIELNNNLWGYGHTYFINKYDMSTHNEYLGQLVAIGVLPSIIYFIFIFRCLYQSYKQYKTNLNPLLIICILFISIYLIIGITENVSLANRRWILCLFFIMGMNTSILYKPRPNTLD